MFHRATVSSYTHLCDQISGRKYASEANQADQVTSSVRPLVLYTYADSETARENFKFFVEKGIYGGANFIFILNGETDAASVVPDDPNIKVIKRENKFFDLGGIGEVLRNDALWKRYKRFITMHDSIKGPFLPHYASAACWTDIFLSRVTDAVKLVGMTVNCQRHSMSRRCYGPTTSAWG